MAYSHFLMEVGVVVPQIICLVKAEVPQLTYWVEEVEVLQMTCQVEVVGLLQSTYLEEVVEESHLQTDVYQVVVGAYLIFFH